jgi:hypothetical protein
MARRLPFSPLMLLAGVVACVSARAETPPLLATAVKHWTEGAGDVAFTQRARVFLDDGSVKEERLERFDPSRPDSQRWHLIQYNGREPTDEERRKIEGRKNSKPRKKVEKSPIDFLDLDHATLTKETPTTASFEVAVRPETSRLLDVEKIAILITVEKEHGNIAHISATLREPMRVLLGIANITNFDLDVGIDPPNENAVPPQKSGEVSSDSTARVKMSKFGYPTEYRWSDFKRVPSYAGPKQVSVTADGRIVEPKPER